MARSLAAALVVVAAIVLAAPARADSQDLANLCRNPAFRNMHEHECVINRPGGGGGRSGGLLDFIGDIIGGIL